MSNTDRPSASGETPRPSSSVAAQLADELRLQAWLAKAELSHPSLRDVSDEASVLAQVRDELRLQAHLGRMELTDDWHQTEERWQNFMQKAGNKAHAAGDELRGLLKSIRQGYSKVRKA